MRVTFEHANRQVIGTVTHEFVTAQGQRRYSVTGDDGKGYWPSVDDCRPLYDADDSIRAWDQWADRAFSDPFTAEDRAMLKVHGVIL